MKKKKIKTLRINLFPKSLRTLYVKARTKFIAEEETYVTGGFFASGDWVKNPVVGEAEWNKKYPDGFDDWKNNCYQLTSVGQQDVLDKINEIVERLNDVL